MKRMRRAMYKSRLFGKNTCPASRHVAIMADYLSREQPYPMLDEEPMHCAGSLMAVVTALWEARTELAKLKGKA